MTVDRLHGDGRRRRFAECADRNPENDETHQACCRFPKTCSPYPYDEAPVAEAVLEPRIETAESDVPAEFMVGDRLDSTFGIEHRGTLVEIKRFLDGGPMYLVERDSDGFVWIGLPGTVVPLAECVCGATMDSPECHQRGHLRGPQPRPL